ncbi:MAG: hypothetical protein P9X26_00595 [Candidatus Stygibacter frigidus]|nr:hypothetical protein [Candidatus Stygibacter frigidus]
MKIVILLVILLVSALLVADEPPAQTEPDNNANAQQNDAVMQAHRFFAADYFNKCWDLIDKTDRTSEDDIMMIHYAHASRAHWEAVGTPTNQAVGEWQISHVYAILNKPLEAATYAQVCLDICQKNNLEGFNLGFAYEALARAEALTGNITAAQEYIDLGKEEAGKVEEKEDREYLLSELNNIIE